MTPAIVHTLCSHHENIHPASLGLTDAWVGAIIQNDIGGSPCTRSFHHMSGRYKMQFSRVELVLRILVGQ